MNLCLCSNLEWAQTYLSLVQVYEVVITDMLGRKNTVHGCPAFFSVNSLIAMMVKI